MFKIKNLLALINQSYWVSAFLLTVENNSNGKVKSHQDFFIIISNHGKGLLNKDQVSSQ